MNKDLGVQDCLSKEFTGLQCISFEIVHNEKLKNTFFTVDYVSDTYHMGFILFPYLWFHDNREVSKECFF